MLIFQGRARFFPWKIIEKQTSEDDIIVTIFYDYDYRLGLKSLHASKINHTVDGWNSAPPGMYETLQITG